MTSAGAPDAARPDDDVLSMVLLADPVSLSVVRERFQRWLSVMGWPPQEVEDVVMAVNEAVSIAVANTDPTDIGAEVRIAGRRFTESDGGRRVMIAVADDTVPADGKDPRSGGAGLLMIHACMDAVELSNDPGGTTVMMTSVRVPPQRDVTEEAP